MIKLFILWIFIIALSITDAINHTTLNFISLLLWIYSCFVFIKRDSEFGILSLFFLIAFTTAGAVSVYAEGGVYMTEIQQLTRTTGATTRVLINCFFLMLFAYLAYTFTGRIKFIYACISSDTNRLFMFGSSALIVLLIMLMFGVRVIYGSPNMYGVDRFEYWGNIAPAWAGYARFVLQHLSMVMGLMYVVKRNKIYIFLFIASVISQILVGDKFTGLYLSVIFFLIPVVLLDNINLWKKIFSAKMMLYAALFLGILVTSSLVSYYAISHGFEAEDKFMNRVYLQAQMWWSVDYHSTGNVASLDSIIKHFFGFGADEKDTGIRYLMGIIASAKIYEIFMFRGVTFTMGSPVNFIYFFGFPLSILVSCFFGMILGSFFRVITESIKSKDVILAVLSVKLYYISISIFSMGDVNMLFDIKTIACFVIFLCYSLLSCLLVRNNKFIVNR